MAERDPELGEPDWSFADPLLSRRATAFLGRPCYVWEARPHERTGQTAWVVCDGVNNCVVIDRPDVELRGAVAELDAGIGTGLIAGRG